MAILNNSNAISTSGGYDINNSLRFRSSASAYLNRTPASTTNRQIFTWSGWVKRGTLGARQHLFVSANPVVNTIGQQEFQIVLNSADQIEITGGVSAVSTDFTVTTTQLFRDPSAWYHFVVAIDTTQATSSNRVKFYVNGTQVTAFGTANYPAQNYNTSVNLISFSHRIGGSGGSYLDAYQAEINFIDGSAKTPSDFGETDTTTGSWKPKAYTGTYGTNGFYLKFSDIATTSGSNAGLGKDFSGNANYWTTNNISVTAGTTYDAMTDSPTLTSATVANYAVLNPVYKSSSQPTISNGNLTVAATTTTYQNAFSSIGVTSGKWYCEVVVSGTPNSANFIGVANATQLNYLTSTTNYIGFTTGVGYAYYIFNGNKFTADTSTAYGNSIASGDIVGIALDLDNGKIWFSKNGTWQASGDPVAGTNAAFTGIASDTWSIGSTSHSGGATSFNHNFGQRPFTYTPPTGFVRLNTFNLPDSTIKKGNSYMDAVLYTGNGASNRTISTNFNPDFLWIKPRSLAESNSLFDKIRGDGVRLVTNSTSTESSLTWAKLISNGFQVDGTTFNNSSETFVGWHWLANGSGSSNTSGTITSTVSVNATAGFSVVTYTGNGTSSATVGHGLGVTPKMIVYKRRNDVGNWIVYHTSLANNGSNYEFLEMNTTAAKQTVSSYLPVGGLSSTTFMTGTTGSINASGGTYVAYCWAEIAGFSKFGSYTGNGSADGPFVYTGFRPAFVMVKCSSSDQAGNAAWRMYDDARNPSNVVNAELYANLSNAEATDTRMDFVSNGFKIRATTNGINGSGATYIFMAFAENPFKNANAR